MNDRFDNSEREFLIQCNPGCGRSSWGLSHPFCPARGAGNRPLSDRRDGGVFADGSAKGP